MDNNETKIEEVKVEAVEPKKEGFFKRAKNWVKNHKALTFGIGAGCGLAAGALAKFVLLKKDPEDTITETITGTLEEVAEQVTEE